MNPSDENDEFSDHVPSELADLFASDLPLRERLDLFFRGDKTVILPIDHGMAIPVPGLESVPNLLDEVGEAIDGVVVNYGIAKRHSERLEATPLCLRTDLYKPAYASNPDPGPTTIYGAEAAIEVEADAVMNMLYTNHPNEAEIFRSCAQLILDCHTENIPVILETLPFGIGRPADYTVENIRFAARAAAELGADVVKTAYPGDKDGFASIVSEISVPIVILGGPPAENDGEFLSSVADAIEAGAAGVAIGRNVWQHAHPGKMAGALNMIVHGGASSEDAAAALKS